jgi:hypothetical protein
MRMSRPDLRQRRPELGQLGAYGPSLATRFNGFGPPKILEVADPPMGRCGQG